MISINKNQTQSNKVKPILTDNEIVRNTRKDVNSEKSKLTIINILNKFFINNKTQFSFYI